MSSDIKYLSRRHFLSRLSVLMSLPVAATIFSSPTHAEIEPWEKRLKEIAKEMKPVEGKVSIELPATASHGNVVPVTVSVISPMTDEDYIETITLMSNKKTNPVLAEFQFSPLSGKAAFTTYLRLKENQEIMALAKTNEGKFFIGRRQVQIALSRDF